MEVKLDQHFLNSKNILLLEKNFSNISNNDIILEIGPGDGRLTEFLLQSNPKKLIAIEMDQGLTYNLDKLKQNYDCFEYILGNGLDLINKFDFNKLISNIPYSITEPLYMKILDLKIPFVLLLHGITFYNIMKDKTCKWYYLINSFYEINLLKEIPGNAFQPKAKTMSVLVNLNLKKIDNLSKLDQFIQILYSKKNRSLNNVLLYSFVDFFKISKKQAKQLINEKLLNYKIPNKKLINLSNVEFITLINLIKPII